MKAAEILAHVDHTLLKQTATWADIQRICDEAVTYHTATVMVPSAYVPRIVAKYGDALKVATVVGFPNGNCNTAAKIAETAQALADGAEEIDMVINIGMLKAGETDYVTKEIRALKKLCGARAQGHRRDMLPDGRGDDRGLPLRDGRRRRLHQDVDGLRLGRSEAFGHRTLQEAHRTERADEGRGRHPHARGDGSLPRSGLHTPRRQRCRQGPQG